jgi:hypothetical protein
MRPPIWVQVRAPGLRYGGRAYEPGELALLAPIDAAVAARRGEVSLTRPAPAAIAAAAVRVAAPPPVLTRALAAEGPAATAPSKRRYRRRDLEPEQ